MAFPEVQNDGTVEVSDADTMNFGEGITATNPSGDTAKLVGPKNTNEATSYDEVQFSGSGDVNVSTDTTAITDDSGESGTRLDVTVSGSFTDTDTRVDVLLNSADETTEVENLNFQEGNAVNMTKGGSFDDVDLSIAVDESAINHNNLTNSSDQDAHHGAGTGLTLSTNTMSVNDPLALSEFQASTRIETPEIKNSGAAPIDVKDSGGAATEGELASQSTIYARAYGSKADGGSLFTFATENCSISISSGILTINFDDTYNSNSNYSIGGMAENGSPTINSKATGSCEVTLGNDPGQFDIFIVSWDAGLT